MVLISASGAHQQQQQQQHRQQQTCWFYLTIALVVASSALAMMLLIKDGFVITNRDYIDRIVEECGSEDGEKTIFSEIVIYSNLLFNSSSFPSSQG